jgi:hypothetical protein
MRSLSRSSILFTECEQIRQLQQFQRGSGVITESLIPKILLYFVPFVTLFP